MQPIIVAFWISFLVTLALLFAALRTGLSRQRRRHLWLGPVAMVSLTVAIVLAVLMGKVRQFPEEPMRIHRYIATTASVLGLLVIATGIWLWRSPRPRRLHRYVVFAFLAAAVAASSTGVWVFALSR